MDYAYGYARDVVHENTYYQARLRVDLFIGEHK